MGRDHLAHISKLLGNDTRLALGYSSDSLSIPDSQAIDDLDSSIVNTASPYSSLNIQALNEIESLANYARTQASIVNKEGNDSDNTIPNTGCPMCKANPELYVNVHNSCTSMAGIQPEVKRLR